MSKRHPINPNLTLLQSPFWQGLPIQSQQGHLIEDYLERINLVIHNAISEHPRTCVFRVDLKFPAIGYQPESNVITRFIESLKSQLRADTFRKQREGKRVHDCSLRYVWVREQHTAMHWHYHVAIFVNRDRFNTWGLFKTPSDYVLGAGNGAYESINMSDRMRKAWASALGIDLVDSIGLVNFSDSPIWVDANAIDFQHRLNKLFHWLSYFAKSATKHYGEGHRHFGCSQN